MSQVEITPEQKELLDVAVIGIKMEQYHKEKNACKETCIRFGERIGHLETEDALKTQSLDAIEKSLLGIVKDIKNLRWQVALIVGGMLGLSKFVDFSKFLHP